MGSLAGPCLGIPTAHAAVSRHARPAPSWVQTPSRLIMFLCLPMSFITSISETRSAKSLSEALSAKQRQG